MAGSRQPAAELDDIPYQTGQDTPPSLADTTKGTVPLDKLLADPEANAHQIVTLSRLFCIDDVAAHRPDGSLSLAVIESDLSLQNNAIKVRRGKDYTLDVEPKLAVNLYRLRRLNQLANAPPISHRWSDHPAIVTVRVVQRKPPASAANADAGGYTCQIVKFEFFEKFDNRVVSTGFKRALRVHYLTRTVSPDGEREGVGDPKEWSSLLRLGHIQNQLQHLFRNMVNLQNQVKWDRFNAQVNAAIAAGARQAVRNEAELENFQRRMMGGR
jgi:hypothetical protein